MPIRSSCQLAGTPPPTWTPTRESNQHPFPAACGTIRGDLSLLQFLAICFFVVFSAHIFGHFSKSNQHFESIRISSVSPDWPKLFILQTEADCTLNSGEGGVRRRLKHQVVGGGSGKAGRAPTFRYSVRGLKIPKLRQKWGSTPPSRGTPAVQWHTSHRSMAAPELSSVKLVRVGKYLSQTSRKILRGHTNLTSGPSFHPLPTTPKEGIL